MYFSVVPLLLLLLLLLLFCVRRRPREGWWGTWRNKAATFPAPSPAPLVARRPVAWIYVAAAGTATTAFRDVFAGYQQLALLTTYAHLGRASHIQFVHRGNLAALLGGATAARAGKMDPRLLEEYAKYDLLARHGGYWISPDTVVVRDLAPLLMRHARSGAAPCVLLSGRRESTNGVSLVPDDGCMVCQPRNPTLLEIAGALRPAAGRHDRLPDGARQLATALRARGSSGGVRVLDGRHGGHVDACGNCVTLASSLSQQPPCAPPVGLHWFTFDRRLRGSRTHGWFARLSPDAVLRSKLWAANIIRLALGAAPPVLGAVHPLERVWVAQQT